MKPLKNNKRIKFSHNYKKDQHEIHIIKSYSDNNKKRKLSNAKRHDLSDDIINLSNVYTILNTEIYGMTDIKTYLLEILNNNNNNIKSHKFALISSNSNNRSGNGKTTLCQTLAKILNYHFECISAEIFKNTNSVQNILHQNNNNNKIMMIYDIEKIRSDIQNTLIDISDKLSYNTNLWIIYCMNNILYDSNSIDIKIKNKMHTFELKEYSADDKCKIVQNYILPKYIKHHNLGVSTITLSEEAIRHLIMMNKGTKDLDKQVEIMVGRIHLLSNIDINNDNIKLPYNINKINYPIKVTVKILNALFPDTIIFSDTYSYFI